MPVALELPDLVALLAEALAWALLRIAILLLGGLIGALSYQITIPVIDYSFAPLGWLADALSSYVLAGAEDARKAVEGAMKATFDALVWSLEELLSGVVDLAHLTKAAFVYLWDHALVPFVHTITDPIRKLATKAEAEVSALATKEARDVAKALDDAKAFGWKRLGDAEAFTRREVAAARSDASAALHAFEGTITSAEDAVIALPGTITADFDHLWDELRKRIDPKDLADLLGAGLLSGMLLRVLTQAAGLDNAACRDKVKGVCSTDPSKWASFLEGLVALGFAFNFRELVAFAESLASEVEPLVKAAA